MGGENQFKSFGEERGGPAKGDSEDHWVTHPNPIKGGGGG